VIVFDEKNANITFYETMETLPVEMDMYWTKTKDILPNKPHAGRQNQPSAATEWSCRLGHL